MTESRDFGVKLDEVTAAVIDKGADSCTFLQYVDP